MAKKKDTEEGKDSGLVGFGGRPLLFKSPEEMQDKVNEYIKICIRPDGTIRKPPTLSGLAFHLGCSRWTLKNYSEKNNEFFTTIHYARCFVETWQEEQLVSSPFANGIKFALTNNFKEWTDKKHVESTGLNGAPIQTEVKAEVKHSYSEDEIVKALEEHGLPTEIYQK